MRHRVDDALQATRAAMAEGIVAGGGSALLHAEPAASTSTSTVTTGGVRDRAALTEPVHLIAANAGYDADEVVKQVSSMAVDEGFDALQGQFGTCSNSVSSIRSGWSARPSRTARRWPGWCSRPTRWSPRSRRPGTSRS